MDTRKGCILVKIARSVIEAHVKTGKTDMPTDFPEEFREKAGVFTTLHTYPARELRGCIGFPEPVMPLIDALAESAVHACHDPRFPPLSEKELPKVVVEVSVLTPPEELKVRKPQDYPGKISIGKDGLIIERGWNRGLLLPQVSTEWGWDAEEFLDNLCMKAGLPPGSWKESGTKIFRFGSEIFAEKSPRGKIEHVD